MFTEPGDLVKYVVIRQWNAYYSILRQRKTINDCAIKVSFSHQLLYYNNKKSVNSRR